MIIKKLKYAKYYGTLLIRNWRSKNKSYAQHGEDLLVEQLLGPIESFIDIGANDGVLFSNTYKFAKLGARGLCVEPSPSTFLKLRLNHLFHPRVRCIRAAVSNRSGSISFIKDGYEEVLSRVSDPSCSKKPNHLTDKPSISVPALTLKKILRRYSIFQQVDLLSVDVEGHEKQVFEGLEDCTFQARIIVLEADKMEIGNILSLPVFKDYTPKYTNGVNLILLHRSEAEKTQIKNYNLPGKFVHC